MATAWFRVVMAAAILLAALPGVAAADDDLGGRPFSPPGHVVDMPASWMTKAIRRPAGADVALMLDQQLYPAMLPLIESYAHAHGIKVAVEEGTCGTAAGAQAEKSADVTGMCCPPGPLDRLPGLSFHTVGIAAIAVIVNPVNPVDDVSLAQARALFGGQTRSWSDLPVSGMRLPGDSEVRAVARLHCQPRPGHWRLLLDNPDKFSPAISEVPSIVDMITQVAQLPTAIGYETLYHIRANAAAGKVKVLRLGGIDPRDGGALAHGRYPLYRVLNITSWDGDGASPVATAMVAWLVAHAADIDASYGIVPAAELRRDGWSFAGDEVVGEPGK